jgi:hypothetical protein
MEWVMVPFKWLRLQPQRLTHCGKQALDRLDGGRDLATLDATDRSLVSARTQRQAALTQSMLPSRLPYQFRCLYKLNYAIKGIDS